MGFFGFPRAFLEWALLQGLAGFRAFGLQGLSVWGLQVKVPRFTALGFVGGAWDSCVVTRLVWRAWVT